MGEDVRYTHGCRIDRCILIATLSRSTRDGEADRRGSRLREGRYPEKTHHFKQCRPAASFRIRGVRYGHTFVHSFNTANRLTGEVWSISTKATSFFFFFFFFFFCSWALSLYTPTHRRNLPAFPFHRLGGSSSPPGRAGERRKNGLDWTAE